METKVKYQVDDEVTKKIKEREAIVGSNYFQAIALVANSLIVSQEKFESDEQLINSAIGFADKLIQKVGKTAKANSYSELSDSLQEYLVFHWIAYSHVIEQLSKHLNVKEEYLAEISFRFADAEINQISDEVKKDFVAKLGRHI